MYNCQYCNSPQVGLKELNYHEEKCKEKNNFFSDHYECFMCGYILSKIHIEQKMYDYNCPRCGKTKLSEFRNLAERIKQDKIKLEKKKKILAGWNKASENLPDKGKLIEFSCIGNIDFLCYPHIKQGFISQTEPNIIITDKNEKYSINDIKYWKYIT